MQNIKLTIIFLLCFYSKLNYADNVYSIQEYYDDNKLLIEAKEAIQERKYTFALNTLSNYKNKINPNSYYLIAECNYFIGQPFKSLIDSSCMFGLTKALIDSTAEFYLENKEFFHFDEDNRSSKEKEIGSICDSLIKADQKNKNDNVPNGSKQDRLNLILLDSIITVHGWPSSVITRSNNIGPAITLAHQAFTKPSEFEYYYKLIAKLCLENKENWAVAQFVLEQRYRWLAGNSVRDNLFPDTLMLTFNSANEIDEQYSIPYFSALSKKLCSNGSLVLSLTVNSIELANKIKFLIHEFELVDPTPENIWAMLKLRGFDAPGAITEDRLLITTDSSISVNEIAYKFDAPK
jgi:hypothetical protein